MNATWPPTPGIYAIVDVPHALGLALREQVQGLLAGGATMVQLRAKNATTTERIEMLREIAPLCEAEMCPLFVNDDVAAALASISGVVGVHLGQDDWQVAEKAGYLAQIRASGLRLGLSTHDLVQVAAAQLLDVDILGFGPVYQTSTKANPEPTTGLPQLREACQISRLPLVAIGGVSHETIGSCADAGASFVAMISSLAARTRQETQMVTARARSMFARENTA